MPSTKSPSNPPVRASKSPVRSTSRTLSRDKPSRRSKSPARPSAAQHGEEKEKRERERKEEEEIESEQGEEEIEGEEEALPSDDGEGETSSSSAHLSSKPVSSPPPATNLVFVVSALAVVISLVWVVLVPAGQGVGAPKSARAVKTPFLSSKAFDGRKLKTSPGFRGSALVSFIDPQCQACQEMIAALDSFGSKIEDSFSGKLKVAKVDCIKYTPLCTEFGVSGDESDASGYPTTLWFRDGELQEQYTDGSLEASIFRWATEKDALEELVAP